ncbi:unnamed protein product [Ascophyllum nodosum]
MSKQLLQNKPLLSRSLRDHRRSGSSKGWQHEVTTKPSSLIREEVMEYRYSIPFQIYCLPVWLVFLCFFCVFLFFCLLVGKISPSSFKRRGKFSIEDGSDWDVQTR